MDILDSLQRVPAAWLQESDLAPFMAAYVHRLRDRHYTLATVRAYVYAVAHFAHWSHRRLGAGDLTDEVVLRFVDEHLPHCDCPPPVQRGPHQTRAALRQLLSTLAEAGVSINAGRADPIEEELRRFDDHMRDARGLAHNTRIGRLGVVRSLLRSCADNDPRAFTPSADELRRFIAQELGRISVASAGPLATALRCFLRYRALGGEPVQHLLPVIAAPAHWRLAPLPRTLSCGELAQLLDAFPVGLSSRLRACAMVRCIADLGLRSREVVALELDDIDWTAGTLRVGSSKSRRADVLPLPSTTGRAIAAYLRLERPTTASRRVFVRHVAPVDEPIGPDVVRNAVRLAYRRCGLPYTRVHILRHTLASRLLETGGTLKEVADVLRHRALDTSMIYAKVDLKRLAAVAMPWPGSTP